MAEEGKPAFGIGSFMWHEHATRDQQKSMDFYSKLCGWNYEEMDLGPNGKYQLLKVGDRDAGGMMEMKGDWGDLPSHWGYYIDVEDVDSSVKQVEELGGKVLHPPTDIPPGRFAAIADPGGSHVYLMTPKEHAKEPPCPEPGHFIWVELMSRDFDKARDFYTKLLGWEAVEMPMPEGTYTVFRNGTGNVAGGMTMPPDVPAEVPSYWIGYVHVADVDKALEVAKENGAQAVMPVMEVPNVGRFTHIIDPVGAAIALMTPAPME